MKRMKAFICIISIVIIGLIVNIATVKAATENNLTEKKLKQIIEEETSINTDKLDIGQILKAYQELSEKYTNDEIADLIQRNSEELEKQGVNVNIIDSGTKVLRNTDEKELNKILTEDIDVNEIQQKLEEGKSPEVILNEIQKDMTVEEKVNVGVRLLLAVNIIKNILIISGIILIYQVIMRWLIYRKAGKHGFAAVIPIYRDVTMLNICGLSPWLLLFVLIPIIGWIIWFIHCYLY